MIGVANGMCSLMLCNIQDQNTALHIAAEYGNNSIITYLLDHGAEINDQNIVSCNY